MVIMMSFFHSSMGSPVGGRRERAATTTLDLSVCVSLTFCNYCHRCSTKLVIINLPLFVMFFVVVDQQLYF